MIASHIAVTSASNLPAREAVNSVETFSDPKPFAAYVGLLFGPNCN